MPTVSVTRAGLAIDGRLFTLLAGQLHYFRYPRAEWRDLLLKARAAGLNTIDTVIPWNLHEPRSGEFDFAEQADLLGYIDLCAELGLYAIVRPGPYICAEWENGGFPAWLTSLPGLELRVDHPLYLEHLQRWFDRLLPPLAERQATRGGPIILCQIENEHWASGRYGHDDHQRTLARLAIERGMDVPQYTCMGPMDDWAEFRNGWSGIAEKLVQTRAAWPANPMIVSELWSGWFDNWGASRHNHKTAARLDMTLHQLTAVGASGWSHWMWAGGTNFGFWGGRTVGGDTVLNTASYDYDAPVSEYGGLTEKFFVARRHHLFMSTLGAQISAVLADAAPGGPKVIAPAAVAGRGEAGSQPYRSARAGSDAPAAWADFIATFLQNPTLEGQTHHVFLKRPAAHLAVEVEAASIKPIFANLPLGMAKDQGHKTKGAGDSDALVLDPPSFVLEYHTARLLGFWQAPAGDTLVLYGREGEVGQLQLKVEDGEWSIEEQAGSNLQCSIANRQLRLDFWLTDRPTVARVRAGERALTLVLLTQARAERWWPLADGSCLCGPDLVIEQDGELLAERRGVAPFYRLAADGRLSAFEPPAPAERPPAPFALEWQTLPVAEAFDDAGWQPIDGPQPLEALGCYLGYGWYRAEIEVEHDQLTTLAAPWLADRARVLVDGADQGWLGVHPGGPQLVLPLALTAGRHELRLLADNLGRFNYGSNTGEQKGLLDTLYWGGRQIDISAGWIALWQEAVFAGEALAHAKPAFLRADAADVDLGNFAFQGPSVWLLRTIDALPGRRYLLRMTGDRNPGALFVNGVALARFSRHNGGGYVCADITALLEPGENTLALNIQGYAGAHWRALLLEWEASQAIEARWSFRAGITPAEKDLGDRGLGVGNSEPSATPGAQLPALSSQPLAPAFHRARFRYDPAEHGHGPFKLLVPGLRKGQIWLNGQNAGRYWQVGPQEAYKLPASWLRADNELLILDEEAADPRAASIATDALGAERPLPLS